MSSKLPFSGGLNGPLTDNEDEDLPPEFTTLAHEQEKSKWSHIDDLDDFFTRVYQYHQNHGMPSLILIELLNLFQIMFLACFSIFTIECIDYETLFQSQKVINNNNSTNSSYVKKNSISDVVFPLGQCVQKIDFKLWLLLIIVIAFWLFRLVKAIYNIARYYEIHSFYSSALNLQTKDLPNITWHEVQEKLLQMQKKHHLCVHKQELTELDIYNRILRFKNYEVAMVNQGVLPPKIDVPILGNQLILLTTGFKYNFEFLLFWGPFAPFRNCYQLRSEYKVFSKRSDLTAELSKSILILGLFNLLLMPVIFIWQLLQFAYNYTELIKRDPGVLGMRRWSNYGRLYLRHFNELDHELDARLSRAYKPAMLYLSSFVSKFLTVLAKFFLFTFGAVFAVLVVLTVYDEDVINVEHVLTIITISGAVAGIARSLIPDENIVYFMDQMMYQILAQVHYMPDSWKLHANSYAVRDEFVKLFQYKFVYLLEELLSPIFTPFILLFWLRPRAAKIVDFLRNFTIDVVGVGDVCSFSQMDTRRHGNPNWMSKTNTKKSYQARNGKTELSLIHFVHTNPNWKMPMESIAFMDQLKDQAIKDQTTSSMYYPDYTSFNQMNNNNYTSIINNGSLNTNNNDVMQSNSATKSIINNNTDNSLNKSLFHLQSLVYNSTLPSNLLKSNLFSSNYQQQHQHQFDLQVQQQQSFGQLPRGAVSRIEGPLFTHKQERQTLLNIAQASTLQISATQPLLPLPAPSITTALENSLDMCFSALYMHELHRKYHHGEYIDLDNVKEENDDEQTVTTMGSVPLSNREYMNLSNVNLNMKEPLLKNNGNLKLKQNLDDDDDDYNEDQDEDNVNIDQTLTSYHHQLNYNNRKNGGNDTSNNNNNNNGGQSVTLKLI